MTMIAKSRRPRAAGYIRMSGDKQERSPAQQKAELTALAEKEGLEVVAWFDKDKAISGDTGADQRPDLGRMLDAAERGEFEVLLLWHCKLVKGEVELKAGGAVACLSGGGGYATACPHAARCDANRLARAAGRGIPACGQTVAHFFGTDDARSRGTRASLIRSAKVGFFRGAKGDFTYPTRRNFVTRPMGTHSTTKMFPSWSKRAWWGWTNRPGCHWSGLLRKPSFWTRSVQAAS